MSPNTSEVPSEVAASCENVIHAESPAPPIEPAAATPETPTGAPAPELPLLTRCCRSLGLLALIGGSVGFCLGVLRVPSDLVWFVIDNQIADSPRRAIVVGMFGGAAVGAGLGLAWLAILLRARRLDLTGRIEEVARRIAPLSLAGFLPFLFNWRMWSGRELTFLFLVAGFSLAAWASFRAALSSPPLTRGLPPLTIPTRLEPLRQSFARAWSGVRAWRWLPSTLVLLGAAGYGVLFSIFTVTAHRNLRTASYDLALENNLVWNALHGNGFFRSTPYSGPTGSHFANHATFFSYVLAPIYALAQSPETLLIIQATMIGAAAIPLFLFARRHLGAWPACLIALCYLVYPPVHGANLYEFHYLPLGAVFLWSALYLLESKRDWLAAVAVILALSVREDVGAGLAIIGAYLLLTGQRPRAGLAVAVLGTIHFCALKLVFMPMMANGQESFTWMYTKLLPTGKNTFGDILKTVVGNPAFTLDTLVEREKLFYLLQLFVPLAFLPLRRPIILLLILPGFFFTLLATGYPPLVQTSFQYTFHWTVFLFIGMVAALEGPRQAERDPRAETVRRRAALVGLTCAMLPVSYQLGAIFQHHTIRAGFAVFQFDTSPQDRTNLAALERIAQKLPPQASVAASDNLLPHVSNRPQAYTLHFGIYDAQYLLVWTGRARNGDQEMQKILPALTSGTYGVVGVEEPFVLARRGEPPVMNNQFLERWGERMNAPAAHAPPVIVVPNVGP